MHRTMDPPDPGAAGLGCWAQRVREGQKQQSPTVTLSPCTVRPRHAEGVVREVKGDRPFPRTC